ncbi:MAG: hypothetical protein ACT4NX_04230 [Deltaproteobacteria bacterium]
MQNYDIPSDMKDMLFVAGGLALVALGFGLLMGHPDVRRMIANPEMRQSLMEKLGDMLPPGMNIASFLNDPMGAGLAGLLPDIERYVKAKSM